MGRILIEINTGNAAFEDNPLELADILEGLSADAAQEGLEDGDVIRDSNGNTIGRVTIEED